MSTANGSCRSQPSVVCAILALLGTATASQQGWAAPELIVLEAERTVHSETVAASANDSDTWTNSILKDESVITSAASLDSGVFSTALASMQFDIGATGFNAVIAVTATTAFPYNTALQFPGSAYALTRVRTRVLLTEASDMHVGFFGVSGSGSGDGFIATGFGWGYEGEGTGVATDPMTGQRLFQPGVFWFNVLLSATVNASGAEGFSSMGAATTFKVLLVPGPGSAALFAGALAVGLRRSRQGKR